MPTYHVPLSTPFLDTSRVCCSGEVTCASARSTRLGEICCCSPAIRLSIDCGACMFVACQTPDPVLLCVERVPLTKLVALGGASARCVRDGVLAALGAQRSELPPRTAHLYLLKVSFHLHFLKPIRQVPEPPSRDHPSSIESPPDSRYLD